MKFTILLSIYHKENPKFLDACFESIWDKQTLRPTQIILVKDGLLTNELEQVLTVWQEKIGGVLKTVPLTQNVGLAMALNEGLRYCDDEWVFRMDTDDICVPDRFQKQVDFIRQHPNVVLLGGQVQEFHSKIDDLKVMKCVPTIHQDICQFAIKRNPFNHMTVGFKKSVILSLGAYHHHWFMEDYNLWLRVLGNGYQVANLPDLLVYARVGSGMYGRRRGWQYIKSEWRLYQLKNQLRIHNGISTFVVFFMRAAVRLFSSEILSKIYNVFLRK